MRVERQAAIIWVRYGIFVLVIAVNVGAWGLERSARLAVLLVSLAAIPLYALAVIGWWEPLRIRRMARRKDETVVIPPHFAWNRHKESRSDWSNVPGTLGLTDRSLYFTSSPLYPFEDMDIAIPLSHIVQVTGDARDTQPGHYLVLTLRDGAKMRLKLRWKRQQARWLQEVQGRIGAPPHRPGHPRAR